jgi:hypothetical protein
MLTAWIPLGDLKPDDGVMLVAAGAHRDAQLKQLYSTYGQSRAGSGSLQYKKIIFNFALFMC